MRKFYSLLFLAAVSSLFATKALAVITVTPGTGGTNICANLAQTGISPAFTTLTPIVVTEGTNGDITAGFRTLTINAPTGWRFNTGATPTVTFTAGRNIIFANVGTLTATQLTINAGVTGTTQLDAITITGLQVQATTGAAAGANITASAATGFTGIATGSTNFGSLSLTPSLTPSVNVAVFPGSTVCDGTTVTFNASPVNAGTPTYQWQIDGADVPGATNSFFSSSTLVTGNQVRVVIIPTGCVNASTASSTPITMTVNALPTAVTVTGGGGFCTSTTLNATNGGSGTIYFQGTTPMGTSTAVPSTSELISASGIYYFRAQSAAGCWGPQGSATVSINTVSINVTSAAPADICLGANTTVTASATPFPVTVLSENFDGGLPGTWSITNISGTAASFWQSATSPGYGSIPGDGSAMMLSAADATGTSAITTHSILSTPSFSLVGYTGATLNFNQYYQFYADGDNSVTVEYSIDGGASWVPFIDQLGATTGTTSWVVGAPTTSVALPAAVAEQPDVRIRWNYNSTWGWYWAIDNVEVTGTPTLTYTWTGISGAAGLSCTSCPSPTITPTAVGANIYSVSTTYAGCPSAPDAGVTINVNPLPTAFAVTGGGAYCLPGTGYNIGLAGSETGVDYQLYNGAAPVGTPVAGTGAAIDFGMQAAAGTYSVLATNTTTGCNVAMTGTVDISIHSGPPAYNVGGGGAYCSGGAGVNVTLDGSDVGIVYQLYNGASMMGSPIGGTGSALDFGSQIFAGTYTVLATNITTGCASIMTGSADVIVNPLPAAFTVTGGGNYCEGGTGVAVGLAGSEAGIDYQLYVGTTASGPVVTGTGAALDFGLQTTVGTYTVSAINTTTMCTSGMTGSVNVTTSPLPAAIAGTMEVCEGSATTLSNTTSGGTWSSGDITVATIGSTDGIVAGIAAGTAQVTYMLPTGCYVTTVVTVNPIPVVAPITGVTNLCTGANTTLASATAGGSWSSADATIAAVDATTGIVTAVAPGATTITYTVPGALGCSAFVTTGDTVTAYPVLSAITGPAAVCVGSAITLTNTFAGGTWTSSDATIAAIDPATGVLTGVAAGTASITYTGANSLGCTTTVSAAQTVNPVPVVTAITGASTVCGGLTTTLSNATPGGVWSSSSTATATVGSSTGIVTAGAVGTVTISYTVTNATGCSTTVTTTLNVGTMMPAVDITPVASSVTLCHGNPVNLVTVTSGTGLSYQWSLGGSPITGATSYYYTATTPGVYTVVVDNGTCTVTLPAKTVVLQATPVIAYNTTGHYLFTGSYGTYQWYLNGTAIAGANSSVHTPSASGSYVVVISDGSGCYDTSAAFIFTGTGIATSSAVDMNIYPNPAASVIYVDAAAPVNIAILSADGKLVREQKNTVSVNVADLANGIYFIKVYDQNNGLLKTGRFSKIN